MRKAQPRLSTGTRHAAGWARRQRPPTVPDERGAPTPEAVHGPLVRGNETVVPRRRRGSSTRGAALGWLLPLLLAQPLLAGEPVHSERARIDYMLNCQGCHLPDGGGAGDVPRMKDFVGNFLKVPGGRAFLVQVPGAANAPLDDARLAALLNWMLVEISRDQLPADFRPYSADEVGEYRTTRLRDVLQTRAQLIQKIAAP